MSDLFLGHTYQIGDFEAKIYDFNLNEGDVYTLRELESGIKQIGWVDDYWRVDKIKTYEYNGRQRKAYDIHFMHDGTNDSGLACTYIEGFGDSEGTLPFPGIMVNLVESMEQSAVLCDLDGNVLFDPQKATVMSVESVVGPMDNSTPEYYDLYGRKVENPSKGIFIKKEGPKTTKIVF